jgi:hypothetical protein
MRQVIRVVARHALQLLRGYFPVLAMCGRRAGRNRLPCLR